jgi:integrase
MEVDLFPQIGRLPVGEITPALMLETLRRVEGRDAHETAGRLLQRASRVFVYALATTKDVITTNPCAGLAEALTTIRVVHQPAMPAAELPILFAAMMQEPMHRRTFIGLELLCRLFPRPSELRFSQWPEFDLDDQKLWRVPAARMKSRREHLVPLPDQAIVLIKELRTLAGRSKWLFPGQSDRDVPLSENAWGYALNRAGLKDRHVPHGFRSTASTYLNESGFDPDHIETQLAHRAKNETRAVYNRALYLDQRRTMLQAYSDLVDRHLDKARKIVKQSTSAGVA